MDKKKLAIFDLDGTITKKTTFLEFLKFHFGLPMTYFKFLQIAHHVVSFKVGIMERTKFKSKVLHCFFSPLSAESVIKSGKEFCSNTIPDLVRPSMNTRLEWHSEQGHQILILTASCDIWVKEWARKKGYDLLCTEVEIVNDSITGKMPQGNNYGDRKVENLLAYFPEDEYEYEFGYGDTSGDFPFLRLVNHAIYREKPLEEDS